MTKNVRRGTQPGTKVSGIIGEKTSDGWSIELQDGRGRQATLPSEVVSGAGYKIDKVRPGLPITCVVDSGLKALRIQELDFRHPV